jgi:hypothetical protein
MILSIAGGAERKIPQVLATWLEWVIILIANINHMEVTYSSIKQPEGGPTDNEFEWPDLSVYFGNTSRRVIKEVHHEPANGWYVTGIVLVLLGAFGFLLSTGIIKI